MGEEHRPESVADEEPVPWEGEGFVLGRFFRTLGDGVLRPRVSAARFATGAGTGRAWLFALLTFVPLAALQGIIPFTHTLRFGDVFGVVRTEDATITVGMDVARAMGIGLLVNGAMLIGLAASYASLARAYGTPPPDAATDDVRDIGMRAVLYRAWLVPMHTFSGLPASLLVWAFPKDLDPGSPLVFLLLVATAAPVLAHFVGLRHAAQRACGCSPGASFAVAIVPFVLAHVVSFVLLGDGMNDGLLEGWLPPVPELPDAGG
ncbi:MAG TPA: hypothetical protein RMH85_24175 [Polyangiaceae bacterium LLY-WYZ-15_(1-7)]|nr:hypothetical protein [Polyangiaceae bacterium LLY-WYZ-15_(1-7)]HJL05929.1 hypothetical protein [Polyangiaceae bacterium LLY-WYZ-15_(1-7)]HJL11595.1 hypothetical protein [Polyangiaceae bacterium LLY-WYZ-15_(1-7)]HJL30838.1 hypothetical protein [Polyangiaceae bacterium LLY-WYZ-15_(1-7)]HJL38729.1 hypothetical protein [Polyangiaceae bacterium LLY-WYZ-15_(1-7)]